MGHTRCAVELPSLEELTLFDSVQNTVFPALHENRTAFFARQENKRNTDIISPSVFPLEEALFSIPFLVFLLYPLEKFIVVSASLFLLLLRGKLPIKRTTETRSKIMRHSSHYIPAAVRT